jgi:hypothetical protein
MSESEGKMEVDESVAELEALEKEEVSPMLEGEGQKEKEGQEAVDATIEEKTKSKKSKSGKRKRLRSGESPSQEVSMTLLNCCVEEWESEMLNPRVLFVSNLVLMGRLSRFRKKNTQLKTILQERIGELNRLLEEERAAEEAEESENEASDPHPEPNLPLNPTELEGE